VFRRTSDLSPTFFSKTAFFIGDRSNIAVFRVDIRPVLDFFARWTSDLSPTFLFNCGGVRTLGDKSNIAVFRWTSDLSPTFFVAFSIQLSSILANHLLNREIENDNEDDCGGVRTLGDKSNIAVFRRTSDLSPTFFNEDEDDCGGVRTLGDRSNIAVFRVDIRPVPNVF
jgi:hypothetical protein